MLLRTDRKVQGTCTSTRKCSACLRMKLYLNHMRRKLRCMFYIELRHK
jgi:hypothetical protein